MMEKEKEDYEKPAAGTVDEEPKKKGLALLIHDLKQKELIPVKILYFAMFSSIGVLAPYLTIHMKSLGITVEETAIIFGVVPIFALFAPSVVGMIADKLGNFKVLLCVILVVKNGAILLFLIIPTGRFIDTYPSNISLAVGCRPTAASDIRGFLTLTDLDSTRCDFKPLPNLSLTMETCGYLCFDSQPVEETLKSLPAHWPSSNQSYKKFRNAIFFPEDWTIGIDCPNNNNCSLTRTNLWGNENLQEVLLKNESGKTFTLEQMLLNGNQFMDKKQSIQCDADYDRPVRLVHPIIFKLNNTLKSDQGAISSAVGDEVLENEIIYKSCRPQCLALTKRSHLCANSEHIVVFDPQLTFWSYMLLRLLHGILAGGSMVLFEGACLAVIAKVKGDLGVQRIFGLIGLMSFSPLSGAMIDYFSVGLNVADYRPAFFLYIALMTIATICVLFVDLNFKAPNMKLLQDVKMLLKNVELGVFFIVVFMSGLFWGYIESYLFWFLEEMGGTKALMGLTVTVSCIVGIPPLLLSDAIFRKIGHPNVQVIGFAVYVVRLVGYSYIQHPYMCLIYEVMEAFTTALMTTSNVAYSSQLGSTTTIATIQGLIGATYYGMGRGGGSFVGGFLMKRFEVDQDKTAGTRVTFRVLGIVAAATGLLYFLFNIFYIRRRNVLKAKKQQIIDSPVTNIGLHNPAFEEQEFKTN